MKESRSERQQSPRVVAGEDDVTGAHCHEPAAKFLQLKAARREFARNMLYFGMPPAVGRCVTALRLIETNLRH